MKKKVIFFIAIATGVVNGLFGSGGGTILVPSMQKFLDTEAKKSHATAIAVILPLTILSSAIYIYKGSVDISSLLWVSAGGVAGGALGAKLLNKISEKWLHRVFGAFMIAAAVKMLF